MGTRELPKEYLSIGGTSVTLIGDTSKAREFLPAVKQMMFQKKLINTGGLEQDWLTQQLPGGGYAHVNTRFGSNTAYVFIPPTPVERGKEKVFQEEVRWAYPVLAIRMVAVDDAVYYDPTIVEDRYCNNTDPATDATWWRMAVDKDMRRYIMDEGKRTFVHRRLDHVGIYGNQYHTSTSIHSWPQYPDDWLCEHELAYRNMVNAFGTWWYNVDPVLFTCGDYAAVTTLDGEFYYPPSGYTQRALSYNTNTDYRVFVDGVEAVAGSDTTTRDYTFTYKGNYNIPGSLYSDMWPEEMIARCCLDPGDYHLYERSGLAGPITHGTQVYWEHGEDTDEWGACLYHYYEYTGAVGISYYYELRLLILDKENEESETYVVYSGSRSPDSDMPDDLYVNDFKLFMFQGKPVVVFAYYHYFWTATNYIKYGMYYNGEVYLTEEFPNEKDGNIWANRHNFMDSREDKNLEGCGQVYAFSIEEITKKEITIKGE